MEVSRTIEIKNEYSTNDIMGAFPVLNTAGIQMELTDETIILNFDGDTPYFDAEIYETFIRNGKSFTEKEKKLILKIFAKAPYFSERMKSGLKKKIGAEFNKHIYYI